MSSETFSRRSFLITGGGALAAGVLLAAGCGTKSKTSKSSQSSRKLNAGLLAIEPYVSTVPQRFAFALSTEHGAFASGPVATIAFRAPDSLLSAPEPTKLHADGLPQGRGVYTVETALPQAGVWDAFIHVNGHPEIHLPFEVTAQPAMPILGASAPRVASPTFANTLDVDPICTRDPKCPLHTVSLDTVIGKGKPVALMFGTPARCESRYCGPVLEQLLSVYESYGDRITFVHCEIYKNSRTNDHISTVDAWGLPGEPLLFGINGAGDITARLDGAMGTDEVRTLLKNLVG